MIKKSTLGEERIDVGLGKDDEDGGAVGGVVNVGAGEKGVDEGFHFVVGEDLAVGDRGSAG